MKTRLQSFDAGQYPVTYESTRINSTGSSGRDRAATIHKLKEGVGIVNSLFKNNTGKIDRIIRIIVGVLLVGNVFTGLQTPVGWIGLILIVTGVFGVCPLYSLLGINTKSLGEKVGLK